MLKPTERKNKRYLAYSLTGRDANLVNEPELRNALFQAVLAFFGELGMAELGFKLISFNARERSVLVECSRGQERKLMACFALLTNIAGKSCRPAYLSTSGTLLKLRERHGIERTQRFARNVSGGHGIEGGRRGKRDINTRSHERGAKT
jgi:RNase P/RNase MRP subunit POP5